MKNHLVTLHTATADEDNVKHAFAGCLEAVEQIHQGYQALEKALSASQLATPGIRRLCSAKVMPGQKMT
ncbi:hypothetical protein [Spirosoma endophyticum]|nr:hypothetical protein [Spirosoma endophyticum]